MWADGVEGRNALEAKYVGDRESSPFVPGSDVPAFIRDKILAGQEDEFYRYGQVIGDTGNPLSGLTVATNNTAAAAYFGQLMDEFGVPGQVNVAPGS